MQYLDFEIDVTAGEGDSYTVKVRSPAGEAMSSMRFPFDQPTLTNRLQALQIALLRSSVTRRRIASPESRTVQEFGQELWQALFAGDVLSRYEASRQEAKHQRSGIRIKFRCDDPELAALPWEYLFDPVRGDFVALSTSTPLVRYIPLPTSTSPLVVTPPIRILAVAVSPSDLDGLDVERERTRLTTALGAIQAKGLIELTWLPGQTWHDFQEALLEGPWHILHFIGHGGFDENRQEGIVAFARPDGKADYKRATSLGRLLGDHEALRLAVLNACESGRGDVTDLFSSTAGTLVRKGTPAVVAMQYEITDEAAIELSQSFYGAIARGIPVDTALTEARKGLATEFEDTLEWGTPVLFLEAPDGVLFNVAAAPVPAAGPVGEVAAPAGALASIAAAGAATPVVPPPPIAPEPSPPEPTGPEPPEPIPQEPEPRVAVTPPPPPRRPPIAILAAGGGAALLGIVLVANIFGGGGAGGSESPSGSGSASISFPASGTPSMTEGPTISASATTGGSLLSTGHGILVQCSTGTDTNSDTSEIYLYDPENTKLEKVTHNRFPDRWPRWSPDGKSVALTRLINDAGDIWTVNAADGGEDHVTRGTANDWGPDVAGGFVYFSSDRNEAAGSKRNDIWRVSLTGERTARVWFGRTGFDDKSPAWSPDGSTMAFSSNHQVRGGPSASAIFTKTADKNDKRHTSGSAVDRNPTWRSDSSALLFTRNSVGGLRDIYSVDPSGGSPIRVTRDSADEGGAVYSPDGDRIAFYRKIEGDWHLLIGDLDAKGVLEENSTLDATETTSLKGKNCIDPSWR